MLGFIITLLAGSGIFYYQTQFAGTKAESTYRVKRQELQETLSLSGKIAAEEKATLRFQTSGYLAWVGVKEGDRVKANQVIAGLDQQELQKTFQKYLNDYRNARWDFDQLSQTTYKDQVITDTIKRTIDQSQFDLNNAVLDVEIKNLAIQFSNLWTPIDGIVTRVETPLPGVNIIPTQAEFEIVNPATIYFSALADQTDVVKLQEGMRGEIVLDSYPEKTIPGIIKRISFTPKPGESETVYEVKISASDSGTLNLRLDMGGDADFVTSDKKAVLAVPLKALKTSGDQRYVYVRKDGKKKKVNVAVGLETDSLAEITSGLTEGDLVYD